MDRAKIQSTNHPQGDDPSVAQGRRTQECQTLHEPGWPADSDRSQELELAAEFLERYRGAQEYFRPNVDALVSMATHTDCSSQARATSAIFESLIEPLSDSFDPGSVELYNRVMAQIIQRCRQLDTGLDAELAKFE